MGQLQTFFYLALLLALFGTGVGILLAVGLTRVPAVWRAGHPVIASLAAAVLVSILLFAVVGTLATLEATFHVF